MDICGTVDLSLLSPENSLAHAQSCCKLCPLFVRLVVLSPHWSFYVCEQTEYPGRGGRRVLMIAHLGEENYFFPSSESPALLGL